MVAHATNAFYASDGAAYWTLKDLGDALVSMHEDTFNHHVRGTENDFANWIEGCFTGDEKLVGTLVRGLDRDALIRLFVRLQTVQAQQVHARHAHTHEVHEQAVFHNQHDDKTSAPVAHEWVKPSYSLSNAVVSPHAQEEREHSQAVREVLDGLAAAELQAKADIGAAREAFIQLRTRVWTELTDAERERVLGRMRDVYENLRAR
jgi:hypothetical protein